MNTRSKVIISPEVLDALDSLPFRNGYKRMACLHASAEVLPVSLKVTGMRQESALCGKCRNKRRLELVDLDEKVRIK